MPVNPSAVVNAYANAAKLAGQAMPARGREAAGLGGGGFADLVKSAIENASTTGNAAETKAAELAAGKTDVVDLVTAVAETEVAIQSMVTVRDRVISAYHDIINMPI